MKDVVLKLFLNELKFDVKFGSWLKDRNFNQLLRSRDKGTDRVDLSFEDKAEMWLVRQVDNAVGRIYNELNWAVCKDNKSNLQHDEINEAPVEWVIRLKFSDEWCGSARALESLTHQYTVAFVLQNWYKSIGDASWQIYKTEADEALESLYNQARSERVSPQPFRL